MFELGYHAFVSSRVLCLWCLKLRVLNSALMGLRWEDEAVNSEQNIYIAASITELLYPVLF